MNLLPNWENAIIPSGKLEDYCLNQKHAKGKDKARVFRSVLGITERDATELRELILSNIGYFDAIKVETIEFGEIWRVDILLQKENYEIILRTNWIIRTETNYPSLVSCFLKV